MTVRLIVAGQFRGNVVGWNSLLNMVDDVTYYRGGTNYPHTPGTMKEPYDEQSLLEVGINETDPQILFVSHNIQNDYNLHVFTNDTLNTCIQYRVYMGWRT